MLFLSHIQTPSSGQVQTSIGLIGEGYLNIYLKTNKRVFILFLSHIQTPSSGQVQTSIGLIGEGPER